MKSIFLIHGYNGIPKIYEWLEKELIKLGYKVIIPKFPKREGAIYEEWRDSFYPYQKFIDENTTIIAHSIGNEFVIRYCNESDLKIDLYISLAGFSEYFECKDREDLNRAFKSFLVTKNDLEKFKSRCRKRYSIYSDNDHIVPFDVLENYPKSIDANSLLVKNYGHMGKKSGLEKIPEVIEIIKKGQE